MKQLRIIMVLDKGLIRLGFQPSPIFSLEVLELRKQTALVWPGFVFLPWVSPVFPVVRGLRGSSSPGFCPTTFHTQNYSRSVRVFTDSIGPPTPPARTRPSWPCRDSPSLPICCSFQRKIPKQIAAWGTCPLFDRIL